MCDNDQPPREDIHLILFIVGRTPNSQRAIENLRSLSNERQDQTRKVEIVDIEKDPDRAREEGIIAIPTLVRRDNGFEARVVGDLSDRRRVISELGLPE